EVGEMRKRGYGLSSKAMRPAELPVILLTNEIASEIRAARLTPYSPTVAEINGRTVVLQWLATRLSGDLGSLFMTFDGTWWRIETRLETFEKRRKREPVQAAFLKMAVTRMN
ncbi:MAG TPA: hypothetical protein P5552_17375, partial [Candidatus Competibacteraceae bacterium]|nr:hypothetical protein [Candidatus Competibacteraceae bacterium]